MKQFIFITFSLFVFATANSQTNISKTISKKEIKANECSKLIFTFGDGKSRIPTLVMRNLTEAKVEMDDLSETDYKLQKFTVTVLYSNTQTFKTSVNIGKSFSEETKYILSLVKPNDIAMVSGISAQNSNGEITYLPERNFGFY